MNRKATDCFRIQGAVSCSVPGSGGTWASSKNFNMSPSPKLVQCFYSNSTVATAIGLFWGDHRFHNEQKSHKTSENLRFWPQCPWRTSRIASCPHWKGYQELNGKPGESMVTKNTLMLVCFLAVGRSVVTKNTFDFNEFGNFAFKIIPSSPASTKGWHSLMSSSKTTRKICRRPISCKLG